MAIKARKHLGQNFLQNPVVLHELMQVMHLDPADSVFEIGPGRGALTRHLLMYVPHITAIEIDPELVVFLRKHYHDKQLSLYEQDALSADFEAIGGHKTRQRWVGNLPYNIATPLVFKLFAHIGWVRDMHLMLQKEVVNRLCAPVGSSVYGRLSVMAQFYCNTCCVMDVDRTSFLPIPRVDSAIVRMIPHALEDRGSTDEHFFSQLVKKAFTHRRKTIANNLKSWATDEDFQELKIAKQLRPQDISVAQYKQLADYLKDQAV